MPHHHPPHGHGRRARAGLVADTRGGLKLVVDGTRHVTGLVEALHGQIQRLAPPLRRVDIAAAPSRPDDSDGLPPARGLTGLVYRSIQGSMRRVGDGLDGLLAPFDGALASGEASPRRDPLVAALNGVLGDHLVRSDNPLAIPMQLRQHGQPLDAGALGPDAPRRVLLLVHGLCMSDIGWRRNGHDHGELLARALGAAPVYVFYNSGRHISDNGRALADALEQLLADWPVPLDEIIIVGHSMGGLVARSALAQAQGQRWPQKVRKLVFLGTPHHGAPLERAGNWLHRVMDMSPYAAPFTRLSRLRSEGITDLRHGNLLAADWQGEGRFQHADRRKPVPLPAHLQAFAVASTAGAPGIAGSLLGDGLVPVDSALGRHKRRALDLGLPASQQWVGHGISHLDLLCDPAVYRKLLAWLG
ncbi:MAG: alpha/beta fold hydrolase [Burkholderiaceae bacterium]|nr:alpha/beta fold hydrolase [Burkholderiaceae bacterium]